MKSIDKLQVLNYVSILCLPLLNNAFTPQICYSLTLPFATRAVFNYDRFELISQKVREIQKEE